MWSFPQILGDPFHMDILKIQDYAPSILNIFSSHTF